MKSAFEKIRNVVKKIPKGKVVTYGQVAKAVGTTDARMVGWALRGNTNPKIPCYRVIKKEGFLAKNYSIGGWREQKTRLEAEEIFFIKENQVDIKKHQWKFS